MSLKKKIVLVSIAIIAIILIWFVYCLFRFGTYAYPWELIGLNNPEKYYEDNIGKLLLKYGEEYELESVDTSNWSVYYNDELRFSFKYPKKYKINLRRYTTSLSFKLTDIEDNIVCSFNVVYNGYNVDNVYLPKLKHKLGNLIKRKHERELYYVALDGGNIYFIDSFNKDNLNGLSINSKSNKLIRLSGFEDFCDSIIKSGIVKSLYSN